ncbi:MAG: cobN [Rhodospirillales bacterium]|nr:cobN [Rhodospirillales bacterium]
MHLLAGQQEAIVDGGVAVDLGQSHGEIVVLTAADSEIACLAAAQRLLARAPSAPSLRLANLMRLQHNYSVDLYVERVITKARLVIVRILGGRSYWPYGIDRLTALCRERGIALALLPGDERADPDLAASSTLPGEATQRLWRYFAEGGIANAEHCLRYAATLIGRGDAVWREPAPLLRAGLHVPGAAQTDLAALRSGWQDGAPVAAVVFYRALMQSANTAPVDALIAALESRGINPLPIFVQSLKDPQSVAIVDAILAEAPPAIVLNGTGFAVSSPGAPRSVTPFDRFDCPVLQVIFASGSEAAWRSGKRGLETRDIVMAVALPEVDGRIITRAVSFKDAAARDPLTEADLVAWRSVADRIDFVADLTRNWLRLRAKSADERRVAIVLANYPNRDGRIGNGVGLDTPASAIEALRAMAAAGYDIGEIPADGNALIRRLLAGPTNSPASADHPVEESLARSDYAAFFATLPPTVQDAVHERWGPPERDPFFREGRLDCGSFAIPAFRLGKIAVGLQPARGYNIDPAASYHSPDLVPPHGYLAFYAWLADAFRADAVVQMGKHGNLEWLPGKAVALSAECFPEAALGPLPHLYPFIVNDPGEGTQAKRRAQAVVVDHLTPPLTRAESYGRIAELERLVDEYYAAAGSDPRRLKLLTAEIVDLVRATGLDRDCGIAIADASAAALGKLDNYLCELKEMQIRDGLHVFGRSPDGEQLTDLLVALVRLPRGGGTAEASLIRALAADLGLGFDPLDCDMGATWAGARPAVLGAAPPHHPPPLRGRDGVGGNGPSGYPPPATLPHPPTQPSPSRGEGSIGAWRTNGDTVERLELLARALVAGTTLAPAEWTATTAVLDWIGTDLRPAVAACGNAEIAGLLAGLAGRFVPPGPSGAPTRGRPEVLPTGRNFYSVDSRAIPTPASWQLGWRSAQLLVATHAQEHGVYPRSLALSAWGTSCRRTGGDAVAQALALMGARPLWDAKTGRVTGFEIMPAGVLDRPRVDVILRVSGFFRDAFPNLIALVDSAARAIAALDEPAEVNPLAARVAADAAALVAAGLPPAAARQRAGYRVFGSKPGAYGAGLQALIDEGGWSGDEDLADAYLAWSGYAYGAGAEGEAAEGLFRDRLAGADAVLHNQDNREHDILDSDDYYQFEGGLAVAVRHLSGRQPALWHGDHSRPETPRIRSLGEEIGRIVRARAANPKWLAGVMRHGYKGGFEIAATVDYLFAFAATTRVVENHHFDQLYDAYIVDDTVRGFVAEHNPDALVEMSRRFAEAIDRGLWTPRLNSAATRLAELGQRRMP